jgi:hypothetical protein
VQGLHEVSSSKQLISSMLQPQAANLVSSCGEGCWHTPVEGSWACWVQMNPSRLCNESLLLYLQDTCSAMCMCVTHV